MIQVVASYPAPMLVPLVAIVLVALGVPFGAGCIAFMLLGRVYDAGAEVLSLSRGT